MKKLIRFICLVGLLYLYFGSAVTAAEVNRETVEMYSSLRLVSAFRQHFDRIFVREFAGEWQREIILGRFKGKPALKIRLKNLQNKGESVSLITTIPSPEEIPDAAAEVIDELKKLIKMKI